MSYNRNHGDENKGGEEPFYESDSDGDDYVPYVPENQRTANGDGQQQNDLLLSKSYLQSIPTKVPKQKEPGELTLYEQIKQEIDREARRLAEEAHREHMEHQPYGPNPRTTTFVQMPRQERMGGIGFIFRPGIRGVPGMPRRPRLEYTEHSDKNGYPRMTKAFKRYKQQMLKAESAKQKRDREAQKKALDELTNINEAFGKTAL